ncbi:MAG: porin [Candidatus Euphemobacter frigidus]|nr:porin [Candidatus Euphemobacter frigidus]MDP8276546.1 porin [Candidatus Euphemobacter frigidus]
MRRVIVPLLAVIMMFFCFQSVQTQESVSREEFEKLKKELAEIKSKLDTREKPAPSADAEQYDFGEYWKDGLHFVSKGGEFDMRVGGRIHIDGAFIHADEGMKEAVAAIPGNGPIKSGWEIRHPRIYLKGRIYNRFLYKVQYTFSDGTIGDAYIGAIDVPALGTVILGKAARAFGNDPGPSSNYTLFMEYANTIIFGAGKQLGLAAGAPVLGNRVSWATQVFQFVDGKGLRTEDNYNLNARLTGLPWYRDKGREMLHLGAGYSYRSSKDDYRLDAKPEIHLAPDFVDTGDIAIKRANLLEGEVALVQGPFSLEGEYYTSFVDRKDDLDTLDFFGWYVQSSFFLTGESRGEQYITAYGEFDSPVRPIHDLDFEKGTWGAWQLAARYSYLHLNDKDIRGGILGDVTLGLNWQFNPNLRWMLNYVHSHRNGAGDADIIAMRLAVNI